VGYASFTFRVNDGTVDAVAANTITIDVTAINDAPSFTQAGNQSVNEDAGAQTVVGFASAAPGGGADEAGQLLSYSVSNDNNALFSVQPTINAAGTLSYTLAADANGVATVTVQVSDTGGTANGGVDTAAAQLFTLTVNAVNDAPTLTIGTNQSVAEDAGAQSVAAFATAAPGGGADEAGQVLSYNVSNDNNALFAQQPGLDAAGNLTYTSAPDAFGSATVTVFVSDGGGTANGGVETSAAQSFTITVTAVNDAPVLGANALTLNQGDSVVLSAANLSASDVDNASATLIFSVSNVANGRFEYVSVPGVGITSFTQADVTNSQVRFVHDGSGTAPAYQITVSDGALSAGPLAASIVFNPGGVVPIVPPPVPVPVVNTLPPVEEAPAEDAPAEPSQRAAVVQAVYSPGRIDPPEAQFTQLEGGGAPARRYHPVATLNTFVAGPHIDPTLELLAAAPANLEYQPSVPADWTAGPAFPDNADTPRDRIDVLLEQVEMGGMALSVGVVWWASRISGLLGSLLASAPAWRHIDPLPVVGRDEDEEKKWYDPEDRDAEANELAIDDVFENARTARGEQQA
jgi:Cadherin-like/Bacterial Ig domain